MFLHSKEDYFIFCFAIRWFHNYFNTKCEVIISPFWLQAIHNSIHVIGTAEHTKLTINSEKAVLLHTKTLNCSTIVILRNIAYSNFVHYNKRLLFSRCGCRIHAQLQLMWTSQWHVKLSIL